MSGFGRLPLEFTFATNVYWDSGVPYNVTSTNAPNAGYGVVYQEPRASRRLPHFYQWARRSRRTSRSARSAPA